MKLQKTVFQGFTQGKEYTIIGDEDLVNAYIANKTFLGIRFDHLYPAEVEMEIHNAHRMERTVILLN